MLTSREPQGVAVDFACLNVNGCGVACVKCHMTMKEIGPFTATSEGYRYAQIMMCTFYNFTKYGIFIPTRKQDEVTTVDALFYQVFMVHVFPNEILSDKGSNYISAVFTRLCNCNHRHWQITG